jgi:hypothetical protein
MAIDWHHDEQVTPAKMRHRQERELSAQHRLAVAEHALVTEACVVGRAFAEVGIAFDPVTFVALRVLEGSVGIADPVDSLEAFAQIGLVTRSAERARLLLEDAA